LVALPALLVNTARYWLPLALMGAANEYVVAVAPAMLANLELPLARTCHCTVGGGEPLPATVNVTVWPAVTAWLVGLLVTLGATTFTVKVAVLLVALPAELLTTTR